ncbi:hypothetical protein H5410_053462 [Solanum commersonii]|uniref:Uncharacterized protein n=1 Tax=Solanum commersonii TaxID=4109 RepID=A0A9J5X3X4_SOLCO|nr:hypothetical protein H5410_053462 [Solanum commersonii]
MGDHVRSLKEFFRHRDELLKTNPAKTCVVRLSEEIFKRGRKIFQLFYICFDALKKAFKAVRRCIDLMLLRLKTHSLGNGLSLVKHDLEPEMEQISCYSQMLLLKGLDKVVQDLPPNRVTKLTRCSICSNQPGLRIGKASVRRNYFGDVPNLHIEQELNF